MKHIKILWLVIIISLALAACQPRTPIPIVSSPTFMSTSDASTIIPLPTLSPTMLPPMLPTPTLVPLGEIQPNPGGYVYLGDKSTMAIGFNMSAGGAIGSLLYQGIEMVDDFDYGRYINFSPYDGSDNYICNSSSCFIDWGWNPLPSGSVDGFPAKVLEYRRWQDGIYIKTQSVNWGQGGKYADVIYELWVWDRGSYFEILNRMNHTGSDTHNLTSAEFPAAYFGKAITLQYGYTGSVPFTGDSIQQYDSFTYDLSTATNLPMTPTEKWMAFANKDGIGLSLVVPNQPYLTSNWSDILLKGAYPSTIGYIAPIAFIETEPEKSYDLHYFLVPGNISDSRSIIYNLITHTTWTFNLNSTEGWTFSNDKAKLYDGILSVELADGEFMTSMPWLNFSGSQSPSIIIDTKVNDIGARVCLQFLTLNDWIWDDTKSSCVSTLSEGENKLTFNFHSNPQWTNNVITQIRLSTTPATRLNIDRIEVIKEYYGWDFDNPQTVDGWVAELNMAPLKNEHSALVSTSTSNDPYMVSPYLGIDAQKYAIIKLRMSTKNGSTAQIFFTTDKFSTTAEERSAQFPIISDGMFHEYEINLGSTSAWLGTITTIRLDPTDAPGDFALDYLYILPRIATHDQFVSTTWNFSLDTPQEWTSSDGSLSDTQNLLSATLSDTQFITSPIGYYFYGQNAPTVRVETQIEGAGGQLCMSFVTLDKIEWDNNNKVCLPAQSDDVQPYVFDFSQNPVWMNGQVSNLRLSSSTSIDIKIEQIKVDPVRYGWEFNYSDDPDNWTAWNNMSPLTIKAGSLVSTTSKVDPYMGVKNLLIPGTDYSVIEIRMKMTAGDNWQIFFSTNKEPDFSPENAKYFPVIADGNYHVYTIDMSDISGWKDSITAIRLDPADEISDITIDYIHLINKE